MFDADAITANIANHMRRYVQQWLPTLQLEALPDGSWSVEFVDDSPLIEQIRLLVRIANGEVPGDLADDLLMSDVEAAIETICSRLFTAPGSPQRYAIPPHFWNTDLGLVIQHCQLWLRGDDLISYTEAAAILWPDEAVQTARMRIKRMVERGELTPYLDPHENNPQRAARVSRFEIENMQGSGS